MSSFSSDFQTLIKHLTSFVFSYELLISLRTECDGCVYIFPFQKVKEDPEVVKRRRERNKIAATKCRKRKRERIEKLQQVLLTLRVTSYDCLSLNQKNCLNCTDLSRRTFKPGSLSASERQSSELQNPLEICVYPSILFQPQTSTLCNLKLF